MAFNKKTWKDRVAEFINRRLLTKEDGSTDLVTVARSEGTISVEGDAFNAETMNDLEDRVEAAFNELNTKIVVGDRTVLPSITIAGNSSDAIEYTIDNSYTRNGYVAVGILGVDTRTVGLFARTFEISKLNTVRLVLDNKNTSSIKQSPFVRILYIKG